MRLFVAVDNNDASVVSALKGGKLEDMYLIYISATNRILEAKIKVLLIQAGVSYKIIRVTDNSDTVAIKDLNSDIRVDRCFIPSKTVFCSTDCFDILLQKATVYNVSCAQANNPEHDRCAYLHQVMGKTTDILPIPWDIGYFNAFKWKIVGAQYAVLAHKKLSVDSSRGDHWHFGDIFLSDVAIDMPFLLCRGCKIDKYTTVVVTSYALTVTYNQHSTSLSSLGLKYQWKKPLEPSLLSNDSRPTNKVAISAHVSDAHKLVPNLLKSLLAAGIDRSNILICVGGHQSSQIIQDSVLGEIHTCTHNSYDHTALIEIIDRKMFDSNWMLLHASTKVLPEFKSLLDSLASEDFIPMVRGGWQNMGLFTPSFIQRALPYIQNLRNCGKFRAILSEQCYPMFNRPSSKTTALDRISDFQLLPKTDIYCEGVERQPYLFPHSHIIKYQMYYGGSVPTEKLMKQHYCHPDLYRPEHFQLSGWHEFHLLSRYN